MSDRPSAGLPNNRFPTGTVPHNGPGRRDKRVTAKFDKIYLRVIMTHIADRKEYHYESRETYRGLRLDDYWKSPYLNYYITPSLLVMVLQNHLCALLHAINENVDVAGSTIGV
ncbi:hypothetical protein QTP88_006536 [Uroleucon formosanum]